MKVLFVTDGILTPASRFRCSQFFPYFEKNGIECGLRYAYGPFYNRAINSWVSTPYRSLCRLRRAYHQLLVSNDVDVLFLQRTAFPHSALIEAIGSTLEMPTVFDFDDSLFVDGKGEESTARRGAFEKAVLLADHLIPGNSFLSQAANQPEKSTIIPTVIDTDRYVPRTAPRKDTKIVLGWMGTAGNFPFLESVVPAIKRILKRYPNALMRIVSNSEFVPLSGVERVQQIPWSAETELDWLQSFDVGLMPLIDSPLTRGKCAFKMIQYMAVGIPVVVSPVGANGEVFESPEPIGFMPDGDWEEDLVALIEDQELRSFMGERGRVRAREEYSIHAVLPRYLRIFEGLAG